MASKTNRRRCLQLSLMGLLVAVSGQGRCAQITTETIAKDLTVVHGAVNGILLERNGKRLAVYGDPRPEADAVDVVLFTHHRRDVVWAGRSLVEQGGRAVVPAREEALFNQVDTFWSDFQTSRFHDYAQQTSKVLCQNLPVARTVQGGDTFVWQGETLRVLDTPGYTRGAVTYLYETKGKILAFTGDLICEDGRLFDLYSFQDAIEDANIRGYHGFAGRLGDLITSLRRLAEEKPDMLIPVRGPVIHDPQAAIDRLIGRVHALYANYLSIDALRWYFGDDHIQSKADRVLGPGAVVNWMPMGETFAHDLPAWIIPIGNSRLIVSSDKSGFLVDCGSPHIVKTLKEMRNDGRIESIDGIFVTHYHDDHADQVSEAVSAFASTVYAHRNLIDLLENPSAYRLPCLTTHPIHVSGRLDEGATWRWKEFELTVTNFPGQTLYHDALMVKKDPGETIYFIGDSFTPSGIDDYCLQNRNFLGEGQGYLQCLDLLKHMPSNGWLINQHVKPAFRFTREQIRTMERTLETRFALTQAVSVWDHPNDALDESWTHFYPYLHPAQPGKMSRCRLKIMNHSTTVEAFQATIHLPEGWVLNSATPESVVVPPQQEGSMEVHFTPAQESRAGVYVISADLKWGQRDLRQWCEAMVTIEP
ncbi:MAG: MBL fold metallo-hydrolase [Planctomycetes bacterium]|nr:MBL fold metallo-hydrolase [Planctomycetota bacterium]